MLCNNAGSYDFQLDLKVFISFGTSSCWSQPTSSRSASWKRHGCDVMKTSRLWCHQNVMVWRHQNVRVWRHQHVTVWCHQNVTVWCNENVLGIPSKEFFYEMTEMPNSLPKQLPAQRFLSSEQSSYPRFESQQRKRFFLLNRALWPDGSFLAKNATKKCFLYFKVGSKLCLIQNTPSKFSPFFLKNCH